MKTILRHALSLESTEINTNASVVAVRVIFLLGLEVGYVQ